MKNEVIFFFLFFPVYFAKSTRYYLLENNKEVAFIWGLSIGELFSNLFISSFFWWNIIQNILQPKIKIIAHFIIRWTKIEDSTTCFPFCSFIFAKIVKINITKIVSYAFSMTRIWKNIVHKNIYIFLLYLFLNFLVLKINYKFNDGSLFFSKKNAHGNNFL